MQAGSPMTKADGGPDVELLKVILARIETAAGPDRAIDQDLFCDLGLAPTGEDGILDAFRAPHYTRSIDDVLTLVDMLPLGAIWLKKSEGVATIAVPSPDPKGWATHREGKGSTFPLSLLAAIVMTVIHATEVDERTLTAS
jgi:hypothetical protein